MTYLIVLGLYVAILFGLFFVSRRRVGLPGLGLAAGALLAQLWTSTVTPMVAQAGVVIEKPPMASIVAILLTLLPALLLMSRAAKAHDIGRQMYHSLVFALLAVSLTYAAFAGAVIIDKASSQIVDMMVPYLTLVTTVGIGLALFDVTMQRGKHVGKAAKGKH